MARKKREIVPGAPHHVWSRGNNRRRLFSRAPDYHTFLRLLWRGLREWPVTVHALVLMRNHLHLLATPADGKSLSKLMKTVCQRYTQLRNGKNGGSGKLWEQSFESKPIRSELQLAVTTAYIEANPVRAGIVADPAAYPWSTYGQHAGRTQLSKVWPSLWTPSGWYERLASTPAARANEYAAVFASYLAENVRPEHADLPSLIRAEAASVEGDCVRIRRPDGTRATEPEVFWSLPSKKC